LVAFKNPIDLDLARFVRRDRFSPMKKNAFVRFYHRDAHYYVIIYPIIPQSLWLAIWKWLLERLRHMHHGRGL